jgi:hypothetical protein
VFDHDPSISFCSDRTVAQSCSRVALKILRRNRTTFCSWTRQSTKSHSTATSSGPFTTTVSNLPLRFIRPSASVFKGSPAHVSTLSGPAAQTGIRPVSHDDRLGVTAIRRESRRLSATGICFLGILSRRGVPPLSRSAYRDNESLGPRRGFHVPRTRDATGMGAPFTPGPAVFTRLATIVESPLAASTSGQALSPGCSSRRFRARSHEASSEVHLRSPVRSFPRPVAPPDGTGALGLLPRASHPGRQDLPAHVEAGTDLEH